MRHHGKKYQAAAARRELGVQYQPRQALEIVKEAAFAKFDETVEVAVRLGVDPRHADQVVRGTVVLPAGTGKSVRVLVIAAGEKAREAQAAGADFVGIEFIPKIKENWIDFDVMIATPDQMGQVGPARPHARAARAHAQPQGRARSRSTSRAPCARSRQARSSSASTRAATFTRRSARSRSRVDALETNFTRVHGPGRPRLGRRLPRACTSATSRSRAPWGPGS